MTRLKTISRSRGHSRQGESEFFNGSLIALVRPLHAFDVSFHAIESFLPGSNMLVYPIFRRVKGVRFDLAGSNASNFLRADEPALFEDTYMLEQRWQSYLERLGKFGYGFRSITQTTEDRPPCRISEGGKSSIQLSQTLSHKGKYRLESPLLLTISRFSHC
jgi:hypothetical protein